MPQPKAPRIDWLLEAWHLAELLPKVPSSRRSFHGIALPMGDIQDDDDSQDDDAIRHDDIIRHFDALLDKVNIQMNHAVDKAVRKAKQRQQVPRFEGTDARIILATADTVLARVSSTDSDLGVVDVGIAVHKVLAHARQHRQLSDDQRVKLPVIVAAMAGGSAAVQSAIAASRPRTRRQDLRAAKLAEQKKKPDANWQVLLYRLQADGQVDSWDESTIHWTDERGQSRTTAVSTFQRWSRPK